MAFGPYDPCSNFLKPDAKLRPAKIPWKQKPRKPISPISPAKKEPNKLYEKAKTQWRKVRKALDGFRCEVVTEDGARCQKPACRNPHHRKGRIGKLLYDVRFFLAVCQEHHDKIHREPKWAYEQGYLVLR